MGGTLQDVSLDLTVYAWTPMVLLSSGSSEPPYISGWEWMTYTAGGAWWGVARNAEGGGSQLKTAAGVAVYLRGDPATVFVRSVIGFVPFNRWYAEKPLSRGAVRAPRHPRTGPRPQPERRNGGLDAAGRARVRRVDPLHVASRVLRLSGHTDAAAGDLGRCGPRSGHRRQ